MSDVIRLFCGVCGGAGLLAPDRLCPACECDGRVQPIEFTVPVLTPADALAVDTTWWSRLAVLSIESRRNRLVARGICDTGRELSVLVRPGALARVRRVTFAETVA